MILGSKKSILNSSQMFTLGKISSLKGAMSFAPLWCNYRKKIKNKILFFKIWNMIGVTSMACQIDY